MKHFLKCSAILLFTLLLQVWMIAALWIDGARWVAFAFLVVQLLWWAWRFMPFTKPAKPRTPMSAWWRWSLCMLVMVAAWWLQLKPSDDRHWAPDYEHKPVVHLEGSRLHISNFRDFQYPDDPTVVKRWGHFEASIDDLVSLDLFLDYWGSPYIAHPMLSFGFKDGQQLVFSIETRRESHETYSAIKGFFRQFELIYLAGSESDLLNLRVHQRKEELYWYRLKLRPETMKETLLDFVRRSQELEKKPEYYHAITSNCSTNLRSQSSKFRPWDYRVLINGLMDEMLYERGLIEIPEGMTFKQYKATRKIDRAKLDRTEQGRTFSKLIRQAVEAE